MKRSPVIFPIPDTAFPVPWADFYDHKTMDERQLLAVLHSILTHTVAVVLVARDGVEQERYTPLVTVPLLDGALESLQSAAALLGAWFKADLAAQKQALGLGTDAKTFDA